jgi:hypothetical protein
MGRQDGPGPRGLVDCVHHASYQVLQQQPADCCPNQTHLKLQVAHVPIHLGL